MKTFALASLLCAGATTNASLLEVRKRNRYLPPRDARGKPRRCPAPRFRSPAHPANFLCLLPLARPHTQFKDNDGSCTLETVGGVLRSS